MAWQIKRFDKDGYVEVAGDGYFQQLDSPYYKQIIETIETS